MKIRIILVDDHKLFREGLRTMLRELPDVDVVGEADNGRDAVRLAGEVRPNVILMDIAMPELNGIDATRQIVQEHPEIKILALTMHSDRRFVREVLKAGASGYLLKDSPFEDLAKAIKVTASNKTYLNPVVASILVEEYRKSSALSGNGEEKALSEREREVLQLIVEGNSIKEIAIKLHLSGKTVDSHRRNLMQKLDIHSVAELTKYAVRHGITALEK